jgi:hypothetical protein
MRKISLLSLLPLVLLLNLTAHSAIPPLSQQDREAYASIIVTGKVREITEKLSSNNPYFADFIYTVTLDLENNNQITFSFWKAAVRPDGMCGPSGQYGMIHKDTVIRAYLSVDKLNNYVLLEPNGFDIL